MKEVYNTSPSPQGRKKKSKSLEKKKSQNPRPQTLVTEFNKEINQLYLSDSIKRVKKPRNSMSKAAKIEKNRDRQDPDEKTRRFRQ